MPRRRRLQSANDRSRILLDDGSSIQNPLPLPPYLGADGTLRAGDKTMDLTGVLAFAFSAYRVHPTGTVAFERLNQRPTKPPEVGGTLKIASFNVLNYFTTLDEAGSTAGPREAWIAAAPTTPKSSSGSERRSSKRFRPSNADVLGIIEVENNASESVADLVSGLNDILGAGTYDFIDTGTVGTDAIKVGFLYKPESVTPVGATAILDNVFPFETNTRPPIAQAFEENATGRPVTVVVNHFKSKGSPCDGPTEGTTRTSVTARETAT